MLIKLFGTKQRDCDKCKQQEAILKLNFIQCQWEFIDCEGSKEASNEADLYGVVSYPSIVIVDDNKIIFKFLGQVTSAENIKNTILKKG